MKKMKNLLIENQQKIILLIGFVFVAAMSFGLGRSTAPQAQTSSLSPVNYTANIEQTQSASALSCEGKIKGSGSYIYHLPGGSFYAKTTSPIACFDTEAQAIAAGFRKSSR